jgi:hypothetical protein
MLIYEVHAMTHPKPTNTTRQKAENERKPPHKGGTPVEKAIAVFTGLTFCAMVWHAFIFIGNENTSRRAQRAWVGPTADSPKGNLIEPGRPLEIEVTLRNAGQSPALQVEVTGGSEVVDRGELFNPYTYKFSEPISRAALLPDDVLRMPFKNPGKRTVTSKDIRSIAKGDRVVYLVGKITYLDSFGTEHHTRFCRALVPESEVTDKAANLTKVTWRWTVTSTGNEMD